MPAESDTKQTPRNRGNTVENVVNSFDSGELFHGGREVIIRHNQERYILRITRQGKLILNK